MQLCACRATAQQQDATCSLLAGPCCGLPGVLLAGLACCSGNTADCGAGARWCCDWRWRFARRQIDKLADEDVNAAGLADKLYSASTCFDLIVKPDDAFCCIVALLDAANLAMYIDVCT